MPRPSLLPSSLFLTILPFHSLSHIAASTAISTTTIPTWAHCHMETSALKNTNSVVDLFSRSVAQVNNAELQTVLRNITSSGVFLVGVSLDVSKPYTSGDVSNSVLPAWRSTLSHTYLTTAWNSTALWSDMVYLSDLMTNVFIPQLDAVAGGSSYMNEADFRDPDFQTVFFGENYDALLAVGY
jgi:hypothetical protein